MSLRGPVTGDAASRIGSIFTPDDTVNANVTYGYDTVGRVNVASDPIAVRNPSLRGPYQFFIADGYRGEHVDPAGGGYSVVTQRSGYLKLYTDEIGRVTQAALDGRGRTLSHTYPEGDQSQFSYDGNDNVLSLTQVAKPGSGLGNLVAMASYDPVWNLPTSVTDFRGYTTQITYYPAGSSGAGEMATATRPNPVSGAAGSGPVYSFSYDSSGRLLTATDPLNIVTANSYDANGYLATTTLDPSGLNLKTTFTNDAIGNVLSVQSPRTDVTQVAYATYDPMRRKLFEISANSNSKDVSGNVLPLLVTEHVYDLLGREVQTLSGTGTATNGSDFSPQKATTIVYDAASNKIQTTLWNGLVSTDATTALGVTQVAYDAVNRPICTAVRLNPSQFASLPGACALSQQGPDGADRISQTVYDLSGQPLQVLRGVGTPGQQVYASYAYGGDGEKLTETDANSNQTAYVYDGFNRLYQTQFPSPSTINTANTADYEQYGYDNNGNRLSLRKRDGVTISYTYDPLNRQTQKAVPAVGAVAGYTVNTVYDLDGRPTSMLYAGSGLGITYGYDNAGRMLTETNTMPAAAQVLTYGYDKGGNKTSIKYPDAIAFTYGYDGMDRFNWGGNSGNNPPTDVGVNFDALGRVSWVGRNHVGGTAYSYDLADRVTKVQIENNNGELWTWSYNAGGQVKTKTGNNSAYDQTPANDNEAHTYDGLNRDAAVTAVSGYDANQNLTTDPVGARSFTYDAENKLVAASGSGTSAAVSLSYDPLGRLYQEVATSGGSSTTTQFLYSGDKLVAEYNGAGVMQVRYLHGPSEDQPLIQYGGASVDGTTAQFLYTDRQGSVVALQNTAGTVQTPFTYGPYGEPASWGGTRFAYTGQIEIPEARLYYYKARVYDPARGAFNQTDPIGYKDNLNLYAYVGDDPLNHNDPTGNICVWPSGAFCANAWYYHGLDGIGYIHASTDYFGAVSQMTANLGSIDQLGGREVSGVSGPVYEYLSNLSTGIREFNDGQVSRLADGKISGSRDQINRQLVRDEQRFISGQLAKLKAENPALYTKVIAFLNAAANPKDIFKQSLLNATAPTISRAANTTRKELGRDIDFSNEDDRVKMGDNMVAERKKQNEKN